MPLGIVSNSDFDSELNNSAVSIIKNNTINKSDIIKNKSEPRAFIYSDNSDSIVNAEVLDLPVVGRLNDVTNIPQSLRKILGEEVAVHGLASAMKLAESLGGHGISQPTLSTYARGEISPGQVSNSSTDLLNHINGRKTKISKRALNKLNLALSLIDEQKLLGCDAKELSSVAKDMAIVSKQMEPREKSDEVKDPVQFHFYAPQIRSENHYETVVAKDNY